MAALCSVAVKLAGIYLHPVETNPEEYIFINILKRIKIDSKYNKIFCQTLSCTVFHSYLIIIQSLFLEETLLNCIYII